MYLVAFMRYFVLVGSLGCTIYTAEEASVSSQIAAKVSSIMKKNEDVVQIANDAALKDLKKMLVTYKKDKNGCILIAMKMHKIDKDDKESLEILKDVPVDMADLLGEKGDAGKYMSEVKAKTISEALAKGKFTGKDWDSLPSYKVLSIKPCTMDGNAVGGLCFGKIEKGTKLLIVVHPEDLWRDTGGIAWENWAGKQKAGNVGSTGPMAYALLPEEDAKQNPIVGSVSETLIIVSGKGLLYLGSKNGSGISQGFIRIKVYEVIPFE